MTKSYRGGKGASGVHQQIINKMPKHKRYIETHLGYGYILRTKKPADSSIAIEIDTAVINDFKKIHLNTITNSDTISFVNDNCTNFLESNHFSYDDLVYADPPYVFKTRKSTDPLYRHEYDDEQHRELLHTLNCLPCFVMISGYDSELYEELLCHTKWYKFNFNAMTRSGVAVESLWCNFNPDDYIKHDYSYMGANFRERERIKRKGSRWVKNLKALRADEKNYILSVILDEFKDEIKGHL